MHQQSLHSFLGISPPRKEGSALPPSPEQLSTITILGEDSTWIPFTQTQTPVKTVLGILGSSQASFWNRETLVENVLNPFLSEIGKMPDSLLIPSEGSTSLLAEAWANRMSIPCTSVVADWTKLGRRAKLLRDSRISKESSHLIIFLGSRSDTYEKVAIREARKGKRVYTVDPVSKEIVEWILDGEA